MSNNEKGATIPPRYRPFSPEQQTPLTEEQRQQKAEEIINNAPLRSTNAESTHLASVAVEESTEDAKPWRTGMGLPVEALMQIRKKTTINNAVEHDLRLAFLVNDRNAKRGFGPKVYVNDLISEAIEQYTKAELKKLGFNTK